MLEFNNKLVQELPLDFPCLMKHKENADMIVVAFSYRMFVILNTRNKKNIGKRLELSDVRDYYELYHGSISNV